MTSRISFSSIRKEDFRRRIYMLALSCLAVFITMPIAFLLSSRNYGPQTPMPTLQKHCVDFFLYEGAVFQSIVLGVGAIIVAVFGFRYLYSRRMTDLYHALPVKRERLFLATYINGLLIYLIPMVCATLLTLLLALLNLTARFPQTSVSDYIALLLPIVEAALKLISVSVTSFLCVYHFALVCVMFCGNVVNALLSIAILGCTAATLHLMLHAYCSNFFDTYVEAWIPMDRILWASPMIAPFRLMADFAEYHTGALFWDVSESAITGPYFYRIMNLLTSMFNFFLAVHLYKKRPSELAEHGILHRGTGLLVRTCAGILAALFGSLIFLWVVDRNSFAWLLFGLLFCGILGFGVTDMLLDVNFKAFFRHKVQMFLCMGFSVLILSVAFFDLTGYDNRLPKEDQIESSSIVISQYTDDSPNYTFQGNTIESIDYRARTFELDPAILYPLLTSVANPERPGEQCGLITVNLTTSFGPFTRRYRITEADVDLLRPIIESPAYLEASYPASLGLIPLPQSLHVSSVLSPTDYQTQSTEEMDAILKAYARDFQKHATIEELDQGLVVGELDFTYPYTYTGSNTLKSYHFNLELYAHFTETLETILSLYPDMVFDKSGLTVRNMEIYLYDDRFLEVFGIVDAAKVSDMPTTVMMEKVGYHSLTLDMAEANELLPYLEFGDLRHNMFQSFTQYYTIGSAVLSSGNYVNLQVPVSNIPLPITDSIEEALDEADFN